MQVLRQTLEQDFGRSIRMRKRHAIGLHFHDAALLIRATIRGSRFDHVGAGQGQHGSQHQRSLRDRFYGSFRVRNEAFPIAQSCRELKLAMFSLVLKIRPAARSSFRFLIPNS